jgi:hypothetical protein
MSTITTKDGSKTTHQQSTNANTNMSTVDIESHEYKKQFLHKATRLAIESVEKGWGGPIGAVIRRSLVDFNLVNQNSG